MPTWKSPRQSLLTPPSQGFLTLLIRVILLRCRPSIIRKHSPHRALEQNSECLGGGEAGGDEVKDEGVYEGGEEGEGEGEVVDDLSKEDRRREDSEDEGEETGMEGRLRRVVRRNGSQGC